MAPKAKSKSGLPLPRGGKNQVVGFGLVSVPIKLKPMIEPAKPVSANNICTDHQCKAGSKKWCSEADHEVSADLGNFGHGYPVNGGFVQLDEDAVDELVAEKTGQLEIERVVEVGAIDPLYFGKAYLCYSEGVGNAGQAFDLLAGALAESGRAAVGTAVLAKQTQMVVLRWSEATKCLIAHVCHFDSEVRWADVELVQASRAARPAADEKAIAMAGALLSSLEGEFDAEQVEDSYYPALQQMIDQATAGVPTTAKVKTEEPVEPAGDLMAALAASVDTTKKAKSKKVAA